MEGFEQQCFMMISHVGTARSSFIEAVQKAKAGDFDGAKACMKAGQEEYLKGHDVHFELLQKEAQGTPLETSLIMIHAEDQMMSAEAFRIIAEEFIDVCRRMERLENRLEER